MVHGLFLSFEPLITLAITSQKGGVGKTTVAVNLAYSLARRGWQTLLLDTDPQGSVGHSLSRKARHCAGFYDSLNSGVPVDGLILDTRLPELKILPAGRSESFFDLRTDTRDEAKVIGDIFSSLGSSVLDVLIVDTAAGFNGATAGVLRHADWVLLPQQAEPLCLRSIPAVLRAMTSLRNEGHKLQVAGVLLTMLQAGEGESADVARQMRDMLPAGMVLANSIPRDSLFLRASSAGVPVGLMSDRPSESSLAFDQLAAEMERKMNLETQQARTSDGIARLMD